MRGKPQISDEEFAKNEMLLFAKISQIIMRAEWLTYILETYKTHQFGEWTTWKIASLAMTAWLQRILDNYDQYLHGELPIEIENTTFPHFPKDTTLLQKMNDIASRPENFPRLNEIDKENPGFAELTLALETREKFIAYLMSEYNRVLESSEKPKNETMVKITHQFIEQLADRLYPK